MTTVGPTAAAIAALFGEELEEDDFQEYRSFFRAGGDSLAALRVLAAIEAQHAVKVPLSELFAHNTPQALADRIAELGRAATRSPSGSRGQAGRRVPLALQQRAVFEMDQRIGGPGMFNTVMQFNLVGDVAPIAVRQTLRELVRRHSALRSRFEIDNRGPTQHTVDAPIEVQELDLTGAGPRKLARLGRLAHLTGFDLSRECIRFALIRTAADAWTVLMTIHHIVVDGMSVGLLIQEFADGYRRQVERVDQPEPLELEYLDFVEWQQEALTGQRLEGHLDHLRQALSSPAAGIAESPPRTYTSVIEPFEVTRQVTDGLLRCAIEQDTTLFVVLSAAVLHFGRTRNASDRQSIMVQAANRSWPGTGRMVGYFSTSLPVLVDLHDAVGPDAVIGRTRSAVARALAHEELPLEEGLRMLAARGQAVPEQHLPQLAFALQPSDMDVLELPGCRMQAVPVPQPELVIDPTSFALVLELASHESGLRGLTHRPQEAWAQDGFNAVRDQLLSCIAEFGRLPVVRGNQPRPAS
jgi:acyl carrier protein